MKHQTREEKGTTIISFEGCIDLDGSPDARRVLLECVGIGKPLLVDLSLVEYIDSSGVASLVESFQKARMRGNPFALVAASAAVLRVLRLAHLDKVFSLYDTIDDALAEVASA